MKKFLITLSIDVENIEIAKEVARTVAAIDDLNWQIEGIEIEDDVWLDIISVEEED